MAAAKINNKEKILANVLFKGIDKDLLAKVIPALKTSKFSNGELIFEDNSKGGCLYLVVIGAVKISKILRTGEEIVLGILHESDFFGEIDLIDRRRRSARAVAASDCTLAALGMPQFDLLIKKSPQFAINLLQMVTLRLRSSNLVYVQHEEANMIALQERLSKTHHLVEVSKIVNSSLEIDRLLEIILRTAAQTVGADRGTLYLVDPEKSELWSKVQKGSSMVEIRMPIGDGIAGSVSANGETVNIPDAYADPRFNPKIDKTTGYRTKTVLCMPMKNREGKIIGVFQLLNKLSGVFTKVDEEFIDAFSVHASIAVENAQIAQKMIQSERLSTVGRMASTIVHDIKNPMSTIRLSAQVLKRKSTDKTVIEFVDDMVMQIDRFLTMTQEILDYARGISSSNIQEVDFKETMQAMLTYVEKELVRRNVELARDLNYSGKIKIDPEKMLRVFSNIAGNSADAMPKGGALRVKAFKRNGNVAIEFTDSGCGMPDDVRAKIFEPFFTYKKKYGTGLGMAIVKRIMDDHDGQIEIESQIEKGTTVRLLLPLVK